MAEESRDSLESHKLVLEIANLKKPIFYRPTFWLGVASAIAALGGVVGQSYVSQYKILKAEHAAQETVRAAKQQVDALLKLEKGTAARLALLHEAIDKAATELASLDQENATRETFADMKRSLSSLFSTTKAAEETLRKKQGRAMLDRMDSLSRQRDLNTLIGR